MQRKQFSVIYEFPLQICSCFYFYLCIHVYVLEHVCLCYILNVMESCSGQILTLMNITTRVQIPGGFASLPAGPAHYKPNIGPRRKLGPIPEPKFDQTSLTQIHYSIGVVRLSGMLIIDATILLRATQSSDTKTPGVCYSCAAYSWMARSP